MYLQEFSLRIFPGVSFWDFKGSAFRGFLQEYLLGFSTGVLIGDFSRVQKIPSEIPPVILSEHFNGSFCKEFIQEFLLVIFSGNTSQDPNRNIFQEFSLKISIEVPTGIFSSRFLWGFLQEFILISSCDSPKALSGDDFFKKILWGFLKDLLIAPVFYFFFLDPSGDTFWCFFFFRGIL